MLVTDFGLYGQELMQSIIQEHQSFQGGGDMPTSAPGNYSFPDYRAARSEVITADNSLDQNAYFVGGGDIFRIYAADMPSINYTGSINENGDLYLQSLGIISLGKISLAQAKVLIANFVKAKLKKPKDIHVSLINVKNVTISISGSVASPGTYTLSGYLRLWDALKIANKEKEQPATSSYLNEYNLRSVGLRHNNSDSLVFCDLLRYLLKGDFSQNPYIYPGDYITVSPAMSRVYIGGAIKGILAGLVPILPDERITDFFTFIPFDPNADSEHIFIQRMDKSHNYQVTTIDTKQKTDFRLENNDIITVPYLKDFSEIFTVKVIGEVNRSGEYPISKRKSTVQDILTLAGGYTVYANVDKAAVIRHSKIPTALFSRGSSQDVLEPLAAMRPELSSALVMMNATRDYSVILIKDHPETILEPGDHLIIPRAEHLVFVSGCVDHPGAYPFLVNENINYYVTLAGGINKRANKDNITIAMVYEDVFQTSTRRTVEDGDYIVVPMAQQYKFLSTILLPASSLFIATAGLLVGIFIVNR
jgi:protein involved in polysaccharide export with SLBB domain